MADYKIVNNEKYIGIVFNTINDDEVDQAAVEQLKRALPERWCFHTRNYCEHEIGFYFYK